MGLVLAFLIGYSVGGRNGRDDLEEVVAAARTVLSSEEFQSFLLLLRAHVGTALTELGTLVSSGTPSQGAESILQKVQGLVQASAALRPTSRGA